MALVGLTAQLRSERGKGAAHRIRHAGALPGVVYGEGAESIMISVQRSDFDRMVRKAAGGAVVVDLTIDGTKDSSMKVLIKDVQRDPVTSLPLHLDLLRISMDKPVHLVVPIHLTGIAEGVKVQGGFMDHVLREVEVQCLPDRIPEFIEVDVTPLQVGDSIHVGDLPHEGIELLTPDERTIVSIHGKTAAAVAAEEAEAAEAAASAAEGEGQAAAKAESSGEAAK